MFLNPSFPRDSVLQRQVLEGVHAVVELDMRAHSYGKIPLQVFDRSAGMNNVRFDKYQDLDPPIAAELVLRARSQAPVPQYQQAASVGGYQQSYGAPPSHQPQPSPHTPTFPSGPHAIPPQQPAVSATDIAGIVGQIDNATLQRLLASLQPQGGALAGANPLVTAPPTQAPGHSAAVGAANPQIDLRSVLGSLKGQAGAVPSHTQGAGAYTASPYGSAPTASNGAAPPGAAASANTHTQVQNIMAHLARFRQ
jgi:nuclear polyadenylated RNA-binding protein 3